MNGCLGRTSTLQMLELFPFTVQRSCTKSHLITHATQLTTNLKLKFLDLPAILWNNQRQNLHTISVTRVTTLKLICNKKQ